MSTTATARYWLTRDNRPEMPSFFCLWPADWDIYQVNGMWIATHQPEYVARLEQLPDVFPRIKPGTRVLVELTCREVAL